MFIKFFVTVIIVILIELMSSQRIFAEEIVYSDDTSGQEAFVCEAYEDGLLTPIDLIILMWNRKVFDKWLAAASVIGWTATIALIIINPPVGMAAALLSVLGLNISSLFLGFGLGSLCGVW